MLGGEKAGKKHSPTKAPTSVAPKLKPPYRREVPLVGPNLEPSSSEPVVVKCIRIPSAYDCQEDDFHFTGAGAIPKSNICKALAMFVKHPPESELLTLLNVPKQRHHIAATSPRWTKR